MRHRFIVATLILAVGAASAGVALAQSRGARTALSPQDYIDIQQLYARYAQTIDAGDAEGWANTFTADGVFNNSSRGHDQLVQFIHDWRDKRDGAHRRHWNSNLVVTPTAGGASGSVYLLLLNSGARPPVPVSSYIYEDALVKTPAGWRFKTRVLHQDPAAGAQ
jgi:bifunctional aromatase (cyclase/dehydratase)